MCGISACISRNGLIDRDRFEAMTDIISHRGPDDRGVYYDGQIALGHRRLSIIDLSENGHQPFLLIEGYVLVFNGEIYNYIELREQLRKKGHVFKTQTDTEVIIHSYIEWGEDCVSRFNGMWAFALLDKANGRFFCSRDRFGIKPFYYTDQEGLFLIASEIKQFFEILKESPRANNDRLMAFIMRGDIGNPPDTLYKDIYQLKPGSNLIFDIKDNKYQIKQYYDLNVPENKKLSFSDSCNLFKESFIDSVRLRLRSDVPVGYFLSGGLDSSSIVCVADQLHGELPEGSRYEQHTISSCYEDKRYDEQEYIDEVANVTKVVVHKVFPGTDDIWQKIDKIIWHMDEPLFSSSGVSQWSVCEAAGEQGIKVILDGQGSDEQLAGYEDFYKVLFIHLFKNYKFGVLKKEIATYIDNKKEENRSVSSFQVLLSTIKDVCTAKWMDVFAKKIYYRYYSHFPFSSKQINRAIKNVTIYPRRNARDFIKAYMTGELVNILHNLDRKTMAFSIEARDPFMDYRLIENIYQMPFEYKIKDGWTKAVLREGMKGIIPDKIRNRKTKLAFVAPIEKWVNEDRLTYRNELDKALDKTQSLFEKKRVLNWFDSKDHLSLTDCNLVWRIIVSGRWIDVFDIKV